MRRGNAAAPVMTTSPTMASQGNWTVLGSLTPNTYPGQTPTLPHSELAKFSFTYTAEKSCDGFVLL